MILVLLIRVSIAFIRFTVFARTRECKNKVNGCARCEHNDYNVFIIVTISCCKQRTTS